MTALDELRRTLFSTKDVGQGTGLGLDVSYRRIIVGRHGGDTHAVSEPGGTKAVAGRDLGMGTGA